MKATINILTLILTAVFVMLFNSSDATNDGTAVNPRKEISISLMPGTPKEATFEDAAVMNTIVNEYPVLAPITPDEATFEDDTIVDLAPVTPAEADFEELS